MLEKENITSIEILLKDQQSCVINGGLTSQYFNLQRGARQGHHVSAYIFILVLEILFLFIRKHPEVKDIEIFEHCFVYTGYTDNNTFFLKDTQSIENLVEVSNTFSLFSGLKTNLRKCKISGIRALKGVQVVVCGMKCINLYNEAIQILGTCFSYKSNIKEECIFLITLSNEQSVLNLWRYRKITLEGQIVVFKSLAIWTREVGVWTLNARLYVLRL